MEPEGSLPYSQAPTTCYLVRDASSRTTPPLEINIYGVYNILPYIYMHLLALISYLLQLSFIWFLVWNWQYWM